MALLKFPTSRSTASYRQTFQCAARKNPSPAFASSCAPQKRSLVRVHVAPPAQALSDVRFNISFILYCDVDHGFVLSMIFCFFDPSTAGILAFICVIFPPGVAKSHPSWVAFLVLPAGILAPLVAVGRFAPSASDPNGTLGRGLLYPFNYESLLLYYVLFDPRRREYSLRSWRSDASRPRLATPTAPLGGAVISGQLRERDLTYLSSLFARGSKRFNILPHGRKIVKGICVVGVFFGGGDIIEV